MPNSDTDKHAGPDDGSSGHGNAPPPRTSGRRAPPAREAGPKYLDFAQIDALFRAIKDPRDRAIFRLAYHRGLRASEIGLLQLADVDRSRWRIHITRKKGSFGGEYPMVEHEIKALRAWLRVRGDRPGVLFPSKKGGPISQQMLDVLMKRYCVAAGIPRQLAHMHALKHSCGTHLVAKGRSIMEVRDHMGHQQIENTLIYAKFDARDKAGRELRDW